MRDVGIMLRSDSVKGFNRRLWDSNGSICSATEPK